MFRMKILYPNILTLNKILNHCAFLLHMNYYEYGSFLHKPFYDKVCRNCPVIKVNFIS